jgi:hypothetical protein
LPLVPDRVFNFDASRAFDALRQISMGSAVPLIEPAPAAEAVPQPDTSAAEGDEVIDGDDFIDGDEVLLVPDNVISPLDMNRFLGALWRNEVLDPEWTAYLLTKLTRVSPGLQYLVGSSGGARTDVSHKNGYYWTPEGWTDNDVGVVRFSIGGTEHAYAVSYYAAHLHDELDDAGFAQRLMGTIWNYFARRYL